MEISAGTEELLRDIFRELYLTAQATLEAMAENSPEKANDVNASKQRFNGLVERARSHLYAQLTSEEPDQLQDYKLESNTLENFKRIHTMLRSICKLILEQAPATPETKQTVGAKHGQVK